MILVDFKVLITEYGWLQLRKFKITSYINNFLPFFVSIYKEIKCILLLVDKYY